MAVPWRDAAGRLSWLKLLVFLALFLPALWLAARGASGDLGARPVTEALRRCGDWTVRLLLLTLAATPARAAWNWPRAAQLRRMLGVATGLYALAHLTLYAAQQNFDLLTVATEIALRFYLAIGFVALCCLTALLATSTDAAQRRLRAGWKKLHRLIFPIAVLALLHDFIQSKLDVTNAAFAAGIFVWLVAWRRLPRRLQARPWALAALALGAVSACCLWVVMACQAAIKLPASRVLAANLRLLPWPRPAIWIALLFAAAALIAQIRQTRARQTRRADIV
jgi:sulfoxide reductase heme-binding subunit YedZ